uniref:3TM-type holin n=1 Tax=Pararhizobium sp. IMCC3301 TaxID=3067904 RepID=UPI00274290D0|nr:3TM-type holin [Pararhizobium sp. IMCC3301]
MIARIIGWITGGALERIGGQLKDAYLAKKQAQTDEQRLEADLRIRQFEAQRDIILAEQQSGITRWIRPAIAFPFVAYLWKVVLWDKVLALGTTDPLSAELGEIMMVMIGAYFLTRPFEKLVRSRSR